MAEQVYAALTAELHDFKWVAGERFSEAELDVEPKLGWFVKPIDFDKLEPLYDLRIVLDLTSIARLSGRSRNSNDLSELTCIRLVPQNEWSSLRSQDAPQVGANDEQLQATVVRAAGNTELACGHWDVTERICILRRFDVTRADRMAAICTEHAAILRAVLARELATAQNLLQSHIEQSKAEVRKITLHMLHQARQQRPRSQPTESGPSSWARLLLITAWYSRASPLTASEWP